jgi:hypothetical protein
MLVHHCRDRGEHIGRLLLAHYSVHHSRGEWVTFALEAQCWVQRERRPQLIRHEARGKRTSSKPTMRRAARKESAHRISGTTHGAQRRPATRRASRSAHNRPLGWCLGPSQADRLCPSGRLMGGGGASRTQKTCVTHQHTPISCPVASSSLLARACNRWLVPAHDSPCLRGQPPPLKKPQRPAGLQKMTILSFRGHGSYHPVLPGS